MVLFRLFMSKLLDCRYKYELLFAFFYGDTAKIEYLDCAAVAFCCNGDFMRTRFDGDSCHLDGVRQEKSDAEVCFFHLVLGNVCTDASEEV